MKYAPLKELELPKIEQSTLPNGMKIYLLENHELPLIRGLALVRTGNLFDPSDKVGLAEITGSLIRSGGTTAKTGNQLDEQLENIAASVESQISESYGSVSFSTLKEKTDEVLATFHDVLTAPAFRQDKLDLIKTQLRSGISRRNDDAHGIAQREFSSLIYGPKTPYGWQLEYATVDNIKRDDVAAFYKRYYFSVQHYPCGAGGLLRAGDEGETRKTLRARGTPSSRRFLRFRKCSPMRNPGFTSP